MEIADLYKITMLVSVINLRFSKKLMFECDDAVTYQKSNVLSANIKYHNLILYRKKTNQISILIWDKITLRTIRIDGCRYTTRSN